MYHPSHTAAAKTNDDPAARQSPIGRQPACLPFEISDGAALHAQSAEPSVATVAQEPAGSLARLERLLPLAAIPQLNELTDNRQAWLVDAAVQVAVFSTAKGFFIVFTDSKGKSFAHDLTCPLNDASDRWRWIGGIVRGWASAVFSARRFRVTEIRFMC